MFDEVLKGTGYIKAVGGGIGLGDNQYVLNSESEDNMYKVYLGTGLPHLAIFLVDAKNEQDAVDRVVDFCEDNEYTGLYTEYLDLEEESGREGVEDVDKYIEECGLTVAGNSCHYIELVSIELINSK